MSTERSRAASLADRMYGDGAPESEEVATPATPDERSLAERMYGAEEWAVSGYRPGLMATVNRHADITGVPAEEREALLAQTALTFRDAGIDAVNAARLHSVMVKHVAHPADEATVREWELSARTALRERYGNDADRRVSIAKQFIEERPSLAQLLADTGLGSHPDIVLALTENPDGLRIAPRKRS